MIYSELYFINIISFYFTFMYSFDRKSLIIYYVQTFSEEKLGQIQYSIIHPECFNKRWFIHNISQYDSQCSFKCRKKKPVFSTPHQKKNTRKFLVLSTNEKYCSSILKPLKVWETRVQNGLKCILYLLTPFHDYSHLHSIVLNLRCILKSPVNLLKHPVV